MSKVLILFAALFVFALSPPGVALGSNYEKNQDSQSAQSLKTIGDLRDAINSKDLELILEQMNEVKRMRYKGEVIPYIIALWEGRKQVDQSLNWEIAQLPVVRLELTNILIQAIRNGFIDMDMHILADYARRFVDQEDVSLARNAILTLSIVNEPDDAWILLEVARRENPVTFGAVIVSLSGMCNSSATVALDKLEVEFAETKAKDYLGGSRPLEFIRHTREVSAPLREFHSGECE